MSGTTPPRADAAPSSPAQKRDNVTHRQSQLRTGETGDFSGKVFGLPAGGAGEKPAGQRLATERRHRVDMDCEGPASVYRGAGAGAGYCLITLQQSNKLESSVSSSCLRPM